MKFFIPGLTDPQFAEEAWQAVKKFAERNLQWGVSSKRIFHIDYVHSGRNLVAEVGKNDPDINEPILVILESVTFLACTPNRGIKRNEPLLIGKNEARNVIYFEGYDQEKVDETTKQESDSTSDDESQTSTQ
jgi:hypothetical protein